MAKRRKNVGFKLKEKTLDVRKKRFEALEKE